MFSLEMRVRDYECDMQGIVNNAIYQHYLEHARHEYLLNQGISFAELTARGVTVVVIRAELDYKQSLRSGERFRVSVAARRASRLKLSFDQEIHRLDGNELVLQAIITVTAIDERGKPTFPQELQDIIQATN